MSPAAARRPADRLIDLPAPGVPRLAMHCPLCQAKPARRLCPALSREICPVCCGTKREVEIRCPETCGYLTSSRTHPPARIRRQQSDDIEALAPGMMGMSEPRQQLFLFSLTLIDRFRGDGLDAAVDADVVSALESLAATYDAAARGLIYEQPAGTAPAQRLAAGIRSVYEELGRNRPSGFAADAAEVVGRLADRARDIGGATPASPRTFLELAGRVARRFKDPEGASGEPDATAAHAAAGSGLILP